MFVIGTDAKCAHQQQPHVGDVVTCAIDRELRLVVEIEVTAIGSLRKLVQIIRNPACSKGRQQFSQGLLIGHDRTSFAVLRRVVWKQK